MKSLLEVTTVLSETATQKKRIEKLTQCMAEERSAQERSVAENRHTKHVVAVKVKLT